MGFYGDAVDVEKTLGMVVQARAGVKIGTLETFGSLETTSATYTAYNASIGLKTATSFNLGELSELGLTISATVEPYESVNVRQPTIYIVTEEECTISIGITQFDYRIMEQMLHHGVMRKLNNAPSNEYLFTFGGLCAIKSRPINIGVKNIACFLPAGADAHLGVTGISFTIYDALCTTGLVWDNIVAAELNTITVEYSGRPVLTNALGNQVGSIYLW